MSIKNVALVGASGTLGSFILNALLASRSLETTVLVRKSSKATFPESVKTRQIPDDLQPQETLVDILRGQDALVLALSGGATDQSKILIDAAIKAGVKRIIPADFGSCDSSDTRSLEIVPLYKEKEKVRNYLIEHEGQGEGKLSWTSLITGHFFDHGLVTPLLGLDINAGTATIFDTGDETWSSTTREGIGMAARRILELGDSEEKLKNKLIYIEQVHTSQNELLKVLEKVTNKSFTVNHVNSDEYIAEHKKKLYKDDGKVDGDVVERLVGIEGIVNGDWQKKDTFVNDLLGITVEDVETVVKRVMQNH